VKRDIDAALDGWAFKPDVVQARVIEAADGRDVIQMRVELGVLQLELAGRPDGRKPHGHRTYFDYLKAKATAAGVAGKRFTLSEQHCAEADREFMQFYHRRVCWLALHEFDRAVADADHTLAFMDFIRDHSPGREFTRAHEQYRGFVLFHRTQAAAAARAEAGDAEGAIDAVRTGAAKIRAHQAEFEPEAEPDEDPMLTQLGRLEAEIRDRHGVGETLREKLDKAVADEDYETAARLRDAIRGRRTGGPGGA
jgi:hypothetical protein